MMCFRAGSLAWGRWLASILRFFDHGAGLPLREREENCRTDSRLGVPGTSWSLACLGMMKVVGGDPCHRLTRHLIMECSIN